jgi:hypothetical protein
MEALVWCMKKGSMDESMKLRRDSAMVDSEVTIQGFQTCVA